MRSAFVSVFFFDDVVASIGFSASLSIASPLIENTR
jgi:hypothetical protein